MTEGLSNNHVAYSIRQVMADASKQLHACSTTPTLDAELLLNHVLAVNRAFLLSADHTVVNLAQQQQFDDLLARRCRGEPIAYLLGYKEFWSKQLVVNAATLIPRPETELLVELALQKGPAITAEVADLGTGSGAVAVALSSERTSWRILATDISSAALMVAEQNAKAHHCDNIAWLQTDWCRKLPLNFFNLIVGNPPYLAANDPHLAALAFEPATALVSGVDGLQALQQVIVQSYDCLLPQGWLLLEHGATQAQAVASLFRQRGFLALEQHVDYAYLPRVTLGRKP